MCVAFFKAKIQPHQTRPVLNIFVIMTLTLVGNLDNSKYFFGATWVSQSMEYPFSALAMISGSWD